MTRDSEYYEKAIRYILANPDLSKTAIRLYLIMLMAPPQELRFRSSEVMEILGITDVNTARFSAEALTKVGLATMPGNGLVKINKPK
jgi:hypothetical protein